MTMRPSTTAFGRLMERQWSARGFSQRTFAQAPGCAPGAVQFVRIGRRRPPLRALDRWADALGLTGDDRAVFLLVARLEHAPSAVREWIAALQADRAAGRARRRTVPDVSVDLLRNDMGPGA